jgi:3-hydroxyacyl-[acyl-carrier-protein] dehydratase
MRFNLVDRIVAVEPGRMLRAIKNLTLGEEYLADHFPTFPVMPGVLMLQTLVEAGSWLLRVTDDFQHSLIVLREAKNVKYGTFMDPGKQMLVTVELVKQDGPLAVLKGKGETEGGTTVSAQIVLHRSNLRDRKPALAATDARLLAHLRTQWDFLGGALSVGGSACGVAAPRPGAATSTKEATP